MTPLIPAIGAALILAGILGIAAGIRRVPARPPTPKKSLRLPVSTRTMLVAGGGVVVGAVLAAVTGWLVAIVLVPVAVVGLPLLLQTPKDVARIDRLEALEEWTRSLAGVFTAGAGLEQALISTAGSAPEAIRPEVSSLVFRLRARWTTEHALRAFADDLHDAAGDLVVANLLLASKHRHSRLAEVLDELAGSVAAEVRNRRQVEADRAKPRATARWVTLITVGVLGVLGFTGSYVAPYGSPAGQLILVLLLGCYVATLVWMRRMSAGTPTVRILGSTARQGAGR